MKFINKDNKLFVIIISATLLFLLFIGIYSRRDSLFTGKSKSTTTIPLVKTMIVDSNGTMTSKITQNTSIDAIKRVKITPRVTGRLLNIYVKRGDSVKKGQILAVLEHDQQNSNILVAEAKLAYARAQTSKAHAEMANADVNLKRYERLLKEGFSTQQQYDSIKTTYRSAVASRNSALANEKQSVAEVVKATSTKEDYIITAPMNGIVLDDYNMTPGTMISQTTPVLDVADLTLLKATLKIPESKIFVVKNDMNVILKFDALPDREFIGKVSKTDLYVEPETRTSKVEIELDNRKNDMILRPGMFGQAEIIEKEEKGIVVIPSSAVQAREDGSYVYVVKNKKAISRKVETGLKQQESIEIRKGLSTGDNVIIFGGNSLKEGEIVKENIK
ncbi:MAG: efflux RND transporter periplasmic adaptor subunit [Synergistaceae bacterium]